MINLWESENLGGNRLIDRQCILAHPDKVYTLCVWIPIVILILIQCASLNDLKWEGSAVVITLQLEVVECYHEEVARVGTNGVLDRFVGIVNERITW